jgi:hypothetical protein
VVTLYHFGRKRKTPPSAGLFLREDYLRRRVALRFLVRLAAFRLGAFLAFFFFFAILLSVEMNNKCTSLDRTLSSVHYDETYSTMPTIKY